MASLGGTVRVLQVPLHASSLNNGDIFLLDNGMTIYQFNAPEADFKERRRAMEIVEQDIKAARDGLPDIIFLDGDEVFSCDAFWELLGGKVDELPPPDSDRDVDAEDVDLSGTKKLFKISDEEGLVMSLEKEDSDISESDINDEDVWVIACGGQCFIYIGESTSQDEKFYVWNNCDKILLAADLDPGAATSFLSKDSDAATWSKVFA